jgi:hypothetical protein
MRRDKSGFGAIGILFLVICVTAIGVAGWYVWQRTHRAEESPVVVHHEQNAAGDAAEALTYTSQMGKFSLQYPSDWVLDTTEEDTNPDLLGSAATLTSPNGTVITLQSDLGGKGGGCEPAATDEPFAPGNTCPSSEYLSSEVLPVDSVYGKLIDDRIERTDVLLITKHYADQSGESQYLIGVTNSSSTSMTEVNEPVMGFVLPEIFVTHFDAQGTFLPYVYVYASSTSADFFTNSEGTAVKAILRTIQITD